MELKLPIREHGSIVKTYTTDTINCSFGVIEDIIDALNFEKMSSNMEIAVIVMKCSKQLKPFLKDVFEGVTDEELRSVKALDIVEIFKEIFKFAVGEIGSVTKKAKN